MCPSPFSCVQDRDALQAQCDDRARQLLDAACEVAAVRTERAASDERLAGISMVNKDLLAQLALVHQQWQASTAEARDREASLQARADAAVSAASADVESAIGRELRAHEDAKRARDEAATAQAALLQERAVVVQASAAGDATSRSHAVELQGLRDAAEAMRGKMADTQTELESVRSVT
jgi:hypothetical protein